MLLLPIIVNLCCSPPFIVDVDKIIIAIFGNVKYILQKFLIEFVFID